MEVTRVKQAPIAEHNLDIGRFVLYPNMIIGEFKEGVHVTFESCAFVIQLAELTFGSDKPLIYISHRLNSYSMDPVGYKEVVELFPNFKGFAIVAKNKRRRMLAHLERLFIKKPIGVFDSIDAAMEWGEKIIEKSS